MGVTKQAAQKRFVAGESSLDPSPDRAKVVVLAQLGRVVGVIREVTSLHLVLGLLAEWDGYAGRAIEAAGATRDAVAGAVEAALVPSAEPVNQHVPFSGQAEEVHELIVRESLRLGHSYVGTEHILLGLLEAEEEPGARLTGRRAKAEVEAWTRRALDEHLCRRAAASPADRLIRASA